MPVTKKRKAESLEPSAQSREPEKKNGTVALANGKAAWACPNCIVKVDQAEPICTGCEDGYHPDLAFTERMLLAALNPSPGQRSGIAGGKTVAEYWQGLRGTIVSDNALQSLVGTLLAQHPDRCFRGQHGSVICWGVDRSGKTAIWFDASEPAGAPDLTAVELLRLLRDTWDIRTPMKAGGKRKAESGKPAKETTEAAEHTEGKAAPADARPAAVFTRVPVSQIDECAKLNPRQNFDQAKLEELARSLQEHGQLENLVVRATPAGKFPFELIAGARRLRAAKIAGLQELDCKVLTCSDAEAIELRGVENYEREQFDAIEEARWFQQLIDEAGYSQGTLAKRLGISQGQVSNRVRLLALPEEFQAKVISGEMTATAAREICPWVERPAVLKEIAKRLKRDAEYFNRDVASNIRNAVAEVAERLAGWSSRDNSYVEMKPTPEERAELDVVKIGREEFCFNVDAWKRLRKASLEKERAKEEKRAGKTKGSQTLSPAEKKRKTEQLRAQYDKRVYRYKIGWLQARVLDRFDADFNLHMAMKWVLWFTTNDVHSRHKHLATVIHALGGKSRIAGDTYAAPREFAKALAAFTSDNAEPLLLDTVKAWVGESFEGFRATVYPQVIEGMAADLKIDLAKEWRVDEAFLLLHTIDQIVELGKEWKVPFLPGNGKRKDLIKSILAENTNREQKLPAPKCLLKAKEVSLA